jgi:hypothetical protein
MIKLDKNDETSVKRCKFMKVVICFRGGTSLRGVKVE